jgi:hypothetical protein
MDMQLCLDCAYDFCGICTSCCIKYNVCKNCLVDEVACEICESDEGVCVIDDYVLINQVIDENWMYWRSGDDEDHPVDEHEYENYFSYEMYYEWY